MGISHSLIITTYNWPAALERVLKSVLTQNVMPDEIIIADDGSNVETSNVVESFASKFSCPLVHSWQKDKGFRLARSRNKAIHKATCEYIIMIDGDMVLAPHFISSHIKFVKFGCFVAGSRVMLSSELSEKVLNSDKLPNIFSKGVIKGRMNIINAPYLSPFFERMKGFKGCNMGFWTDDAIKVNGFDDSFQGWGGEDTDFRFRLINSGLVRRKLKMGGVAFHLFHPRRDRSVHKRHLAKLKGIIDEKIIRCEHGIDEFDKYEFD